MGGALGRMFNASARFLISDLDLDLDLSGRDLP